MPFNSEVCKNMIKALFFDIDGTLVSFATHDIPDSSVSAIKSAQSKGIKVFIATGRDYSAINNIRGFVPDGYITLNGGCCIIGNDKKIIYKKLINRDSINSLIDFMQNVSDFPCIFVTSEGMLYNYLDNKAEKLLDQLNFPRIMIRKQLDYIRNCDIFQLIAFFSKDEEHLIMSHLPHAVPERWSPVFADVVPEGSGKHVGINKMLEYYGWRREECMCFGDGGNDKSMLQYCGVGIAMGNATDDVKDVADFVTDTVDNDGIYNALKHFNII